MPTNNNTTTTPGSEILVELIVFHHAVCFSHRDGTPGGQMVTEQFQVDWATVLVSSFSTIVVRFDGHGSGFQGTNLLHKVRRKLGKLEERDQLEALRSDSEKWAKNYLVIWLLSLSLLLGGGCCFFSFSGWYPNSLTSIRIEWEFMER